MHEHEVVVTMEMARELVNDQFPAYAGCTLTPVQSLGTVNVLYRLGTEMLLRFPRVIDWATVDKECKWIPYLAPHLPLRVPEPVALGQPTDQYPCIWGIFRWIPGDLYLDVGVQDEADAACRVAAFVNALHAIPVPEQAPCAGRLPLKELDDSTREAMAAATELPDHQRLERIWADCLQAQPWEGVRSWIHADLLRTNLLVNHGRISAVLDFGSAGAGDPAHDLIPAWSLFGEKGRRVFRQQVRADADAWGRARGYALHQAALIIPYYRDTNPGFVSLAMQTMREILQDDEAARN
jgi:aminoglycoside phosphotransferase (APT) family kinase protein